MFIRKLLILAVGLIACLLLFLKIQHRSEASAPVPTDTKEAEKLSKDDCAEKVCLTFVGNLGIGDNFFERAGQKELQSKDRSFFFAKVEQFLKTSPFVVAALETPLIDKPKNAADDNRFWSERKHTPKAQASAGITAVSLAGKHILDFGSKGLDDTISLLNETGIVPFGAINRADGTGEVLRKTFQVEGTSFEVAVLGINFQKLPAQDESSAFRIEEADIDSLASRVQTMKTESPNLYVVVYAAMGGFYERASKADQANARKLIDAGADLIVGYGSRALKEIEKYNEKWIVYGLGNFVFTSKGNFSRNKRVYPFGGMLRVVLSKRGSEIQPALRIYPIDINNDVTSYQTRFPNKADFGFAFWSFLVKGDIEYDWFLKKNMIPDRDRNGGFIRLEPLKGEI